MGQALQWNQSPRPVPLDPQAYRARRLDDVAMNARESYGLYRPFGGSGIDVRPL